MSAMDAERTVEDLISRCVSLLIYYHHLGRGRTDPAMMEAEFHAIVDDGEKFGLEPESVRSGVLAELYHRFERDTAIRLHGEFAEASGIA
jgi:hypothetical protein